MRSRRLPQIIILCVALFMASFPASSEPLIITDALQPTDLWTQYERISLEKDATLQQAIDAPNWIPPGKHAPDVGFTRWAEWMRFTVVNPQDAAETLRFFWHHAQLDHITIYQRNDNITVNTIDLSALQPVSKRPFQTRMPQWALSFAANTTQTVYIRVESAIPVSLRIKAGHPDDIEIIGRTDALGDYLYLGIMLSLILYNLSLALSTGDRSYWLYSLYVSAISLYVFTAHGFSVQWGIVETSIGQLRFTLSTAVVWITFALLFTYQFLNLDRYSQILKTGFIALLATTLCLFIPALWPSMTIFAAVAPIIILIDVLFILGVSLNRAIQKQWYAIFFFLGWTFMLLGMLGHEVSIFIGFDSEWFAQETMKLGTAIEAILLSWSVGFRFQAIREENKQLIKEKKEALEDAHHQLKMRYQAQTDIAQHKDEILSLISHELKTPLNVIQSTLDLLNSQQGIDTIALVDVQDSSEVMRRHIDNLVMLSEVTTGQAFVTQQLTDLTELAGKLNRFAKHSIKPEQQWSLRMDENTPRFGYLDERKVSLLVQNLIGNAIKFSTQGHVTLEISSEPNSLRFTVKDQGIGMDDTLLNTLGGMFKQNDASMTRSFGGLGIGLNVVKNLVGLLDGKIHFISFPSEGTEVELIIPYKEVNASFSESSKIQGHQALIVDDNLVNLKLMTQLCKRLGYEIRCAGNGKEAVEWTQKKEFDIIFMDLQMPVMDGFSASQTIRDAGFTGKIIAVSANDTSMDRQHSMDAGMDEFLSKPVRMAELRSRFSASQNTTTG